MAEERLQRRLAAILSADVVGYSRLMGIDEAGTLACLNALRRDIINPIIAAHSGRIVKLMGDGALVEFASAVDAVSCAVEIQKQVHEHDAGGSEDNRIQFRIGINLGDVIVEGGDIYGDGVNIAARLEGLAEPGGICISEKVFAEIRDKLDMDIDSLGPQMVKNIASPIKTYRVRPVSEMASGTGTAGTSLNLQQEVYFCRTFDSVQIAYSCIGEGMPIVKTGNWMTHLEYDLESPIWRHFVHELAKDHAIFRYDARGSGLSDWDVEDISFDAFVSDLEAVADASGVERFALLGISQGCAVSIAYAVRHPERVTHLALYGGFALGWKGRAQSKAELEQNEAMLSLMRHGWGQQNPMFRQLFTTQLIPDGTKEQTDWLNELQRISTSPDIAARNLEAFGKIDVMDLLPRVTVPTLVMHAREDAAVPFDAGRRMAAGIPGARFVPLESRNHLILEDEPAFGRFLEEIYVFLQE